MGLVSLTQSPTVNTVESGQGDTCFCSRILGLAVPGGWMDGWMVRLLILYSLSAIFPLLA